MKKILTAISGKKFLGAAIALLILMPAVAFAQTSVSNSTSTPGGRYGHRSYPAPAMGGHGAMGPAGSTASGMHTTPMRDYLSSAASSTRASTISGTVSSVSGESISLTGSNSTDYTVDATNAKIVRKFGATMTIGDIQNGDALSVVGVVSSGSVAAKTIRDNSQQQKNASFSGSVSSVNGSSFVLATTYRGSQTINTSSATVFKERGQTSVSISSIVAGENVEASGVWDSTNSTTDASTVTIVIKSGTITGALTAVSGTTLTVTASGTSQTVYTVDASGIKKLERRYGASTDLSALQTGDTLKVSGIINGSAVTASVVRDMSLQARDGTFVGTVSALGGDGASFTLQSKERGLQTINTVSTTIFRQGAASTSYFSLAAGQTVTVSGVWDRTNSNVTANRVTIKVASAYLTGTLTNISGTTLNVTNASGTPFTVDASKAHFQYKGGRSATVTILQVNDQVLVRGTMVSGSSNIAASYVRDQSQTYVRPTATTNTTTQAPPPPQAPSSPPSGQ